jgi:Holliday junction resolvase RusA-like endonuclease
MADEFSFFVAGHPVPGGSKRPVRAGGTGKILLIDDAKGNKQWRQHVTYDASRSCPGGPLAGPLEARFEFIVSRPRSHYGTGRNIGKVRASAPPYPIVKPDTTKLVRSTEDALKGICWNDDSQIVRQFASKSYGHIPGVRITVRKLAEAFLDA